MRCDNAADSAQAVMNFIMLTLKLIVIAMWWSPWWVTEASVTAGMASAALCTGRSRHRTSLTPRVAQQATAVHRSAQGHNTNIITALTLEKKPYSSSMIAEPFSHPARVQ
jgi:hypothetical protein